MAGGVISLIGFGTTSYTGTSTSVFNFSGLTDISGAGAVTLQQDDLVICYLCHSGTAARTNAQLAPTTTGYSTNPIAASPLTSNDTDFVSMNGFFKFMGASPDSSVTLPGCAAATNSMSVVIFIYRGVDLTTPLAGVAPTTVTAINGTKPDPPSISTPAAPSGCVAVGVMAQAQATGAALTAPTTTAYDATANFVKAANNTATTNDSAILVGHKTGLAVSTAFNASAANGGTTANTDSSAALSFILKPNPQTLTASIFTNSQTFPAPTVSSTVGLTPALKASESSFAAPTVGRGAVNLTPPLLGSAAAFFAPIVAFPPQALTPALFSNSPSFPAPTVQPGAVGLVPSLLANAASFSAPTVGRGAVNLSPGLLASGVSFAAPTISTLSAIVAPLLTNAASFAAPTVAAGPVNLSPSILANAPSFPSATVQPGSVSILPARYQASTTFSAAAVSSMANLAPALFGSQASFAAPTVGSSYGLVAGLMASAATFASPTVQPGTVAIVPPLLGSANQFFGPSINGGAVELKPSLLGANDTFPSATVTPQGVGLAVPHLPSQAQLYAPAIAVGPVNLAAGLFGSSVSIHAPSVGRGAIALLVPSYANAQIFPAPTIDATWAIEPPHLASSAVIYGFSVANSSVELLADLFVNESLIYPPSMVPLVFGGVTILPAENLLAGLPGETRLYVLPPENRLAVLPSEAREVIVPRA